MADQIKTNMVLVPEDMVPALVAQAASLQARVKELEEGVEQLIEDLTCRPHCGHYCQNCDRSLFNAKARARALVEEKTK